MKKTLEKYPRTTLVYECNLCGERLEDRKIETQIKHLKTKHDILNMTTVRELSRYFEEVYPE